MWNLQLVFFILLCFALMSNSSGDENQPTTVGNKVGCSRFKSSGASCMIAGGICLPQNRCSTKDLLPRGTCANGSVCCKGIDKNERRCEYLTGECRPTCPGNLIVDRAENCPANEFCCVLVV